jgi:hypothetical protein
MTSRHVAHIVVLKFKEEISSEQISQLMQKLVGLKERMPYMLSFSHGTNMSPENLNKGSLCIYFLTCLGFNYAFHMTFTSAENRDAYLVDEEHQQIGKTIFGMIDDVVVFDFEI